MTEYLTPDEVATQLQVTRQVVYNWINDGRLRAVKAGRTLRIPQYALEAFLEPVHAGDISTGGVEPERALPIERFSAAAQAAAVAASGEVRRRQHTQIEVEHVLWVLVDEGDGSSQQALRKLGVNPQEVARQLDEALASLPSDPDFQHPQQMTPIAERTAQMLKRAEELANLVPDLQIDTSHMLMAICEEEDGASANLLKAIGVTPERLRGALVDLRAGMPAAPAPSRVEWEQRIEEQLTRIETEVSEIRAMLSGGKSMEP